MNFSDNCTTTSPKKPISEEEMELNHHSKQMWQNLKLQMLEQIQTCITVLMYGVTIATMVVLLIAVPVLTSIKLQEYDNKVKLEASMQSSNTICLPRNQKE